MFTFIYVTKVKYVNVGCGCLPVRVAWGATSEIRSEGQGAVSAWNGRCSGTKKKGKRRCFRASLAEGAEVQACVLRHPFFYVLIGLPAMLADVWPFAYGL